MFKKSGCVGSGAVDFAAVAEVDDQDQQARVGKCERRKTKRLKDQETKRRREAKPRAT
jgi:hypothetical protein